MAKVRQTPLAVRRRRVGPAVWDPAKAANGTPYYPKTAEAYEAKRERGRQAAARMNAAQTYRTGIPNGWGSDDNQTGREKIAEATELAQEFSKGFVKVAVENGVLPTEDARVERAFEVAVECLNAENDEGVPLHPMRERLAAGRFLADFLKSKPASKVEATVTRPEDFLALLAKSE